jgi:hypothetical protein
MIHILIDYNSSTFAPHYFFTVVEGSIPGPKTCTRASIPPGEVKTEVTITVVTITSKVFGIPHASFHLQVVLY